MLNKLLRKIFKIRPEIEHIIKTVADNPSNCKWQRWSLDTIEPINGKNYTFYNAAYGPFLSLMSAPSLIIWDRDKTLTEGGTSYVTVKLTIGETLLRCKYIKKMAKELKRQNAIKEKMVQANMFKSINGEIK